MPWLPARWFTAFCANATMAKCTQSQCSFGNVALFYVIFFKHIYCFQRAPNTNRSHWHYIGCMWVVVSLNRYILAAGGCHSVIGCRRDDIIYSPLPQYHSVAGMIALAGTMHHGISMAMARKFSASKYWPDCVKYNVTVSRAFVA